MKRKKIIFIFLSLVLFLSPFFSHASVIADFSVRALPGGTFYYSQFNQLVLDFTVPNLKNDGSDDQLSALTVKNNGSARDAYEIDSVKLWVDKYDSGWQGWGYDEQLATAIFLNDNWYFKDLSLLVPSAGSRLFVTIDTRYTISAKKTVQFYVSQLNDATSNGIFDLSDEGIFMSSKLNGPTNGVLMNENLSLISTANYDLFAPEAVVTNIVDNQGFKDTTSVSINGQAKDQGGRAITLVQVGIGTNDSNMIWHNVSSSDNYLNWSYGWSNIQAGNYILKTKAQDEYGNVASSNFPIHVSFSSSVVVNPVPIVIENSVLLPDRSLIKGPDSKVYVVAGGKKRWIADGKIFKELGYKWSKIQTISDTDLAKYQIGDDIKVSYTHPEGTLIKYETYPQVYLLEGGQRRHVFDEATFNARGYKWDEIITISDGEYYPEGVEIK